MALSLTDNLLVEMARVVSLLAPRETPELEQAIADLVASGAEPLKADTEKEKSTQGHKK